MSEPRKLTKAEAGRVGAVRRWGEQPRIVRLDELDADHRRLVLAFVEMAKATNKRMAGAVSETPAPAEPGGHAHDRQAA